MPTNQPPTYNFNAGPAMLPIPVMKQAQSEFLNYGNTGISLMEMSHRSKEFQNILDSAEDNLRSLLSIPSEYSIGFFPGGASLQFSCVPLNLLESTDTASYSLTGVWSVKALKEAKKFSPNVGVCFDGEPSQYHSIPKIQDKDLIPNSKFLYITSNNTIYGTKYPEFPEVSVPIIADMTSELLSRKLDITRFGAIFAGAQKNIGPSGLTVLIARNDFLTKKKHPIPILLDWKNYLDNHSLYNTPPTYPIYIASLVFDWLKNLGGIEAMELANEEKAKILYDSIDNSGLYHAPVPKEIRSIMNVVFHLKDKSLESKFIEESELSGLKGLKGHRDAGGMRASIYNAMPRDGVLRLIEFLKDFEKRNG